MPWRWPLVPPRVHGPFSPLGPNSSGTPPTLDAITGVPHAGAWSGIIGAASFSSVGNTNTSAAPR